MARAKRDIYGLDQKIIAAEKGIKNRDDVSTRNKALIFKFIDYTKFQGKSKQTQYKRMYSLAQLASEIKTDFDKLTRDDVKNYIAWLHDSKYADATQQVRKMSLKLIVKWMAKEEDNKNAQKLWEWLNESVKTTLKAKNEEEKMDIDRVNLLTEEEVLSYARSVKGMDRAFVMALYESGARIGEILPLKRGDIEFQDNGYALITVTGKTGRREIPLKACVPDLARWLNDLPNPDDQKQPVWIVPTGRGKGNQYDHRGMKRRVYSFVKQWNPEWSNEKVQAKFHFHNFRHSRATELAKRGWSEYEMCLFFGWKIGSKIPSVYIKLSGRDLINRIKQDNAEEVEVIKPSELKTIKCSMCGIEQSAVNTLCHKCGTPLTLKEFTVHHAKQRKVEKNIEVVSSFMEMMMQQPEGGITLNELQKVVKSMQRNNQ